MVRSRSRDCFFTFVFRIKVNVSAEILFSSKESTHFEQVNFEPRIYQLFLLLGLLHLDEFPYICRIHRIQVKKNIGHETSLMLAVVVMMRHELLFRFYGKDSCVFIGLVTFCAWCDLL